MHLQQLNHLYIAELQCMNTSSCCTFHRQLKQNTPLLLLYNYLQSDVPYAEYYGAVRNKHIRKPGDSTGSLCMCYRISNARRVYTVVSRGKAVEQLTIFTATVEIKLKNVLLLVVLQVLNLGQTTISPGRSKNSEILIFD